MNLLTKAPFAVLAFFFACLALILACITSNQACYDQPGLNVYTKVFGDGACDNVCTEYGVKLIGTATTANLDPNDQYFFPANRVARCPWRGTGKRLFLSTLR